MGCPRALRESGKLDAVRRQIGMLSTRTDRSDPRFQALLQKMNFPAAKTD